MILPFRQTHEAAALLGFRYTTIEGMRAVVVYTHLRTLRDMPMSAKY